MINYFSLYCCGKLLTKLIWFCVIGSNRSTRVSNIYNNLNTINVDEAFDLVNTDYCNLIDIRDIRELQKEGQVDGASHIPRGMLEFWLDPNSSYYNSNKIGNIKKMVLFCAAGFRSALAAKSLVDMGFKNVAHVDGGFDALKNAGMNVVEKEKK